MVTIPHSLCWFHVVLKLQKQRGECPLTRSVPVTHTPHRRRSSRPCCLLGSFPDANASLLRHVSGSSAEKKPWRNGTHWRPRAIRRSIRCQLRVLDLLASVNSCFEIQKSRTNDRLSPCYPQRLNNRLSPINERNLSQSRW